MTSMIVARPYDQEQKCSILGEFISMIGRSISALIAHLIGLRHTAFSLHHELAFLVVESWCIATPKILSLSAGKLDLKKQMKLQQMNYTGPSVSFLDVGYKTSPTSNSVVAGIGILRTVQLYHPVNSREIQLSGCNVCTKQNSSLLLQKLLQIPLLF